MIKAINCLKQYFFKHPVYVSAATILVVGLVGFWAGYQWKTSQDMRWYLSKEVRQKGNYKFINPLLECEEAKDLSFGGLSDLRDAIEEIIESDDGKLYPEHISVYFRDLNNGPWIGINEREEFTPASLLKVPLMIAYLKQAETDPQLLGKKIAYKPKDPNRNLMENIKPSKTFKYGEFYTIEEILRQMIIYSDNNAAQVLFENVDENFLNSVYSDLGVELPDNLLAENFITVKEYASFFRVLFNTSYLSRSMSEKALTLLSEVEYKGGIPSGLPADVSVAHKFGERKQDAMVQLHDCGIVYYPGRPYLLCVMSRGDDLGALEQIIQDISKVVYEEIRTQDKQ